MLHSKLSLGPFAVDLNQDITWPCTPPPMIMCVREHCIVSLLDLRLCWDHLAKETKVFYRSQKIRQKEQ